MPGAEAAAERAARKGAVGGALADDGDCRACRRDGEAKAARFELQDKMERQAAALRKAGATRAGWKWPRTIGHSLTQMH